MRMAAPEVRLSAVVATVMGLSAMDSWTLDAIRKQGCRDRTSRRRAHPHRGPRANCRAARLPLGSAPHAPDGDAITYGHAGDGNLYVNVLGNDHAERPAINHSIDGWMRATRSLGSTLYGEAWE